MVQNTKWENAVKAVENIKREELLDQKSILELSAQRLMELIRPAGSMKSKSRAIQLVSQLLMSQNLDDFGTGELRKTLLDLKGIGDESADVILLYAFGRPVFPVSAYARKIVAPGRGVCSKPFRKGRKLYLRNNRRPHSLRSKEASAIIVGLS